jgi:hypothetical protein
MILLILVHSWQSHNKKMGAPYEAPNLTNYKPNASSTFGHRTNSYDNSVKKDWRITDCPLHTYRQQAFLGWGGSSFLK